VQSDNIARFSIQETERREAAETAGFRHNSGFKLQVVNNHEISKVIEPQTPKPQVGRSVEPQIKIISALAARTATQC
jgi:hypothetical protein